MNARLQSGIILATVVLLDRITKLWILSGFPPTGVYPVVPNLFHIVHAENPGAAFSMLADAPELLRRTLLVGISLVVTGIVGAMLWNLTSPAHANAPGKSEHALPQTKWMRLALTLICGGAIGNLIDRIARGTVTDFIQIFIGSYEFPAFNIADSAITVGACLLAIDLIRADRAGRGTDSHKSPSQG